MVILTVVGHSPVSFQTTPADTLLQRTETVGKVQPHVKAKVIDSNGEVVPIGMPGELCVAGYLLQKGYGTHLKSTLPQLRGVQILEGRKTDQLCDSPRP